jgi:hypothetical protein
MKDFKRVYDVGPSGLWVREYDVPKGTIWVVAWYDTPPWEGHGFAVAKVGRGKYYGANLDHCSCYGPLDQDPWHEIGNFRMLLRALRYDSVIGGRKRVPEDYDYEQYHEIEKQVKKLHRQERRTRERRRAKRSEKVSSGV